MSINDPNCYQEQAWLRSFVERGKYLKQYADLRNQVIEDMFDSISDSINNR